MGRPEITKDLSRRLEQYIAPYGDTRIYWAREVTFDYSKRHPIRVDYMRFKPRNNTPEGIEDGLFYCYEIKSSIADFHSPNGHNFIGNYNYYVMPEEVFGKIAGEIPKHIGVLCPDGKTKLRSTKKAVKQELHRPLNEMLLMMFRSAARDRR